jgi:WD40 repeat protein
VLEAAFAAQARCFYVGESAVDLVRRCERAAKDLLDQYQELAQHGTQSPLGCAKLASVKAGVRAIWLDGALALAQSPHGIAARFRHLVCCVGLRLLRVREALLREGIPVAGWVLRELIREDPGVYPSDADPAVALQAIQGAQVALDGLENEKELAVREKVAQSRRRLDQRRASLIQESELNQIRSAKKGREQAITRRAGEDAESVRGALCEEVFSCDCGGGLGGQHGGAVAIYCNYVFAASNDKVIDVIDLETTIFSKFVRRFQLIGHSDKVLCLLVVGQNLLFSGSVDCTLRVWNINTMECLQVLVGHSSTVSCLALASEDDDAGTLQGKYICSGSYDTTIKIWSLNFNANETKNMQNLPTSAQSVDLLASLTTIRGTSSLNSQAKQGRWECYRTLFGHGCYIHTVVANGSKVYSAGEDGLIKVWSIDCKHSIGQLEGSRSIYGLCLSKRKPNEIHGESSSQGWNNTADCFETLYSCGIDLSVCAWNLQNERFLEDGLVSKDDAAAFELSPKSELDSLLTEAQALRSKLGVAMTPEAKIWISGALADIEEKISVSESEAETLGFVREMCVKEHLLYSGGGENLIRIWNLQNRSCAGLILGIGGGVHSLSADSRCLALSCFDNRIRVYMNGENQAEYLVRAVGREQEFAIHGGALMAFNVKDSLSFTKTILSHIRVHSLCCGSGHCLLLDASGQVWAWGSSERGQTGRGTRDTVLNPTRIACHEDTGVVFNFVAAGNLHSIALTAAGEVWVFGDNSYGQLGMVSDQGCSIRQDLASCTPQISEAEKDINMNGESSEPQSKHYWLPVVNSSLKVKISSACGGACHTIFLSGEVFPYVCTPRHRTVT